MNENDLNGNIVPPENNATNDPVMPGQTQNMANDQGVMTPPPIDNTANTLPEEPKKKSALPIILVVVLLLVAVCGFFAYKMLFTNPIEKSIESLFKEARSNNVLGKTFKETANITFESSQKELEFLKNYSIVLETSADKNLNMISKLVINEKGQVLLDPSFTMNKNNIFFKIPKVDNKTYSIENTVGTIDINPDDINYLINKLEEALKKAFKDEKLNKKNLDMSVGSKTVSVNYNYYLLDDTNIERVTKNFLVPFEEAESLKRIANLTKREISDIKQDIEDIKEDAKDGIDEKVKIGVLTKGLFNDVVGFEIDVEDKPLVYYVEDGNNGSGKVDNEEDDMTINITKTGNDYVLDINSENEKVATINVKEVSKNETNMNIVIPEYMTIKLTTKIQETSTMETFDTSNAVDFLKMNENDQMAFINGLSKAVENSELYGIIQSFVGGGSVQTQTP